MTEVAPKKSALVKTRFSRFSSSVLGKFPEHLYKFKYVLDEYEDKVKYDPIHVRGEYNETIDFTSWLNCRNTLIKMVASEKGLKIKHLVFDNNPEMTDELLTFVLKNNEICKDLLSLSLRGCKMLTLQKMERIASVDTLHTLNFSHLPIVTDSFMELMIKRLKQLKSINVCQCTLLTNTFLLAIANKVKNHLVSLECSHNPNFTMSGINEVVLHCENINLLDISYCPKITFVGIVVITFGQLQNVSRNIEHLKLAGLPDLTMESLNWVCIALPQLHSISLDGVKLVNDSIVQGLFTACEHLTSISFNGCSQVTNLSVAYIASRISNITHLALRSIHSNLQSSAVNELLLHATLGIPHRDLAGRVGPPTGVCRLTSIDLSFNAGLSDDCIKPRSNNVPALLDAEGRPLPTVDTTLRKLNIEGTSFSSYGVALLAKRYTHLEQLNLSGLKFINDSALVTLSHSCKGLRYLWASDCITLSDAGIVALCAGCRQLTLLHISWLCGPGGGSDGHNTISSVDLYKQYTDKALIAILQCPHLRDVAMCNQLLLKCSAKWFKLSFPQRGNTALQSLDLRGCNNLAGEKLQGIFKLCLGLNNVLLPHRFFDTELSRARWHHNTFKHTVYTREYDQAEYDRQWAETKRVQTVQINTKKESMSEAMGLKKPKGEAGAAAAAAAAPVLLGWHVLMPVENKKALEFRDLYCRERWRQDHAIRFIQMRFRLHIIWVRFRTRVMARRIANTYSVILKRRRQLKRFQEFVRNHAAKVIQHCFYKHKVQYLRAAKVMQKATRKWLARRERRYRDHQNKVVVCIQKMVRGMLVRISERYILAQIYLKLPPFWREVMKITPRISQNKFDPAAVEDGKDGKKRGEAGAESTSRRFMKRKIHGYEISELRQESSQMLHHILNDVVTNKILAPKLPFIVPQPFDKKAYVSLGDGRKISFFGHSDTIFDKDYLQKTKNQRNFVLTDEKLKQLEGRVAKYDEEVAHKKQRSKLQQYEERKALEPTLPVHTFNVTFWPLTEKPELGDASILEHDPSVNNFEVAQNTREVLFCEVCRTRLRIIQCSTCLKGYCFFCAFRTHTEKFKRNHHMSVMEPRIIKFKEVTKSLVYHIDIAQGVAHDLGYLVKYMRSSTEVKRIQRERELLKEYEKQEEQRRLAFLKASEESREKHQAADKIALLYRSKKAKRIVAEKRVQVRLEKVLHSEATFAAAVLLVQTVIRMYLVRVWLYRRGLRFKVYKAKMKVKKESKAPLGLNKSKLLTREEVRNRVARDVAIRTSNNRKAIMAQLAEVYSHVLQLLDANITFWKAKYYIVQPFIERYVALRDGLYNRHKEESISAVTLRLSAISPVEVEKHEIYLRGLFLKVEAADNRLENYRNMNWWVIQHLRSNYRKKAIVKARMVDTIHRLKWVAVESATLARIEHHMKERHSHLSKIQEMETVAAWIKKYVDLAEGHQIALDSQQETILKEELTRLEGDEHTVMELDSLVEELHKALVADNQYTAERIYLDHELKIEVYGSERAIRLNEQLILLKSKQKQLNSSIIDSLKVGLQDKYNAEDEKNVMSYAFPNDHPDMPIEEMSSINAILIEEYIHPHHCHLKDFLSVYMVQPWLAEQSVEDVRLEETVMAKEVKLGKVQEELNGIKNKLKDAERRRIEIEKRQRAANQELNDLTVSVSSVGEDDDTIDTAGMKDQIIDLNTELAGLDVELNVMKSTITQQSKLVDPVMESVNKIVAEILEIKDNLKARQDKREKAIKLFFDTEKVINDDLVTSLLLLIHSTEENQNQTLQKMSLCEQFSYEDSVIEGIFQDKITLAERAAINVPKDPTWHVMQDCLHSIKPRTHSSAVESTRITVQTQLLYHTANEQVLEAVKAMLEVEEEMLLSFKKKRPYYEGCVVSFRDALVGKRRQRALQLEIEHRLRRLVDLRAIRLRAMQEQKEAQIKEDNIKAEIKRAKDNKPKENRLKKMAAKTKQAIRGMQDAYRDLKYANEIAMNEEEKRMAKNIREKTKDSGKRAEGIKAIKFTLGKEETEYFKRQNEHLESKGLPFFTRMERSLGNQLFLWTQNTFDHTHFITNLALSHIDPENEHHLDLRKEKYDSLSYEPMKLELLYKVDRHRSKGIKAIALSLNELEENRLMIDGFEKLEPSLECFELPDTFLWIQKVEKVKKKAETNIDSLLSEVVKVRQLLKEKPTDRNLQDLVARQNERLEEAYQKELAAEVTNPLQSAIELMALTQEELQKFMAVFAKIDKNKSGKLSLNEVFEFFEETPTKVAKEIFYTLDALDENDEIEFGDFMRAIATYGFFGKEEILRFLYVYADRERVGHLTTQQFHELVHLISPYEKLRATRALKGLNLGPKTKVTFKDFKRMNEQYPALFLPAFLFQHSIRTKCMGDDWWFHKLSTYKAVRNKMGKEGGNTQEIVSDELARFDYDAAREKRMKDRDMQIKEEKSEIKKTILQARQFLDEFT